MTEVPRYVSSRVGFSRAAQPLELYVSSDQERKWIALITMTKALAVFGKRCVACQSFVSGRFDDIEFWDCAYPPSPHEYAPLGMLCGRC